MGIANVVSSAAENRDTRARQRIDRKSILKAAMKLTERHGLQNVSMRLLGEELGVATMAPYKHYENREALIVAIVDEVCRLRLQHRSAPGARWEEQVASELRHASRIYQRYPGVADYVMLHGPRTAHGVRLFDKWLRMLDAAGFGAQDSVRIFEMASIINASLAGMGAPGRTFDDALHSMSTDAASSLTSYPRVKAGLKAQTGNADDLLEWWTATFISGLKTRLGKQRG